MTGWRETDTKGRANGLQKVMRVSERKVRHDTPANGYIYIPGEEIVQLLVSDKPDETKEKETPLHKHKRRENHHDHQKGFPFSFDMRSQWLTMQVPLKPRITDRKE